MLLNVVKNNELCFCTGISETVVYKSEAPVLRDFNARQSSKSLLCFANYAWLCTPNEGIEPSTTRLRVVRSTD